MRIGIIGSGRIGGNAGRLFAGAGHEVLFSFSRDRTKLEALAAEADARAGALRRARHADVGGEGSLSGEVIQAQVFHPEHIPERYGLFTLIVLGASVLAVAAGTAGTGWYPASVATAVFGFVIAACIWWLYFDYVGASGLRISPRAGFFWGYGHLGIYAGIAATGVGIQLAIEGAAETTAHGSLGTRGVLGIGLAAYLLAVSFIHWVNRGSLDDRALSARLATAAFLILLVPLGSFLSPLAFAALTALALLALTAYETVGADVPA